MFPAAALIIHISFFPPGEGEDDSCGAGFMWRRFTVPPMNYAALTGLTQSMALAVRYNGATH